jgi:hypothetical protein
MKKLIASGFLGGLLAIIGLSLMAPRDGNGAYSLPAGNPVVSGTPISSSWANTTLSDLATAMASSIAKDGQTVPTANLPMGGFKHTNVADATARNQYAAAGQVQDGSLLKLGSVSGTNTITGNLTPAITSYVAGMAITLIPAGNNTGATTLAVNGLTALDVQKFDGDALANGDLVAGIPAVLVLDSGADDWILLNPQAQIDDYARQSQSNTFTAAQTISGSGSSMKLKLVAADSLGDNYIGLYSNDGTTRRGYIGNGSSLDNTIHISNEVSGAAINLVTTGGGAVLANGTAISLDGHTHAASDTTSGTFANARISSSSVTQHLTGGVAIQANARNITVKASTTKVLVSNASCPPAASGDDGRITYCY